MLGHQSAYAKVCRQENYIGANFDIDEDLSDFLYDNWRDFNKIYSQAGKSHQRQQRICL